MNGTDFVASLLTYPVNACTFPNNCGTYGLVQSPAYASSPKLDAIKVCARGTRDVCMVVRECVYVCLQAFIAGEAGPLPFTSADLPAPVTAPCTQGCVWGLCTTTGVCVLCVCASLGTMVCVCVFPAGVCACFEGFSGPNCTVSGPKRTDCAAPNAGVNLGGFAEYDTEISYIDVMKRSTAWTSQNLNTYSWGTGVNISMNGDGYPAFLLPNQKVRMCACVGARL